MKTPDPLDSSLLTHLAAAYHANADAEVSGAELEHVLGLDAAAVKTHAAELAREGLVEWDPLLTNVWLRITDKGLAVAQEGGSGPAADNDPA